MWESLLDRLTNKYVLVFTILTYLVPYIMHKLNLKLHKAGDPPWKKKE